MKTLMFIAFSVLFFVPSSKAQENNNGATTSANVSQPMDDCNTVLIYTNEKPDAAYKTLGRLFFKEGYEFEQKDPDLLVMSTRFTSKKYGLFGMGELYIKLSAQLDEKDSLTIIKMVGFTGKDDRVSNRGMSGSPAKSAWNILNDFCLSYPQKERVEYLLESTN
jgi:hypothetical protein